MITKRLSLTAAQWDAIRDALIDREPRDEEELQNQIAAIVALRDVPPARSPQENALDAIVDPITGLQG